MWVFYETVRFTSGQTREVRDSEGRTELLNACRDKDLQKVTTVRWRDDEARKSQLSLS